MDNVSKAERSRIMTAIRNRDSKIEVHFRKSLWRLGFRYRKNASSYVGKPDIVLKKYKTVIFVDSCFWHGCRWHCRMPASNKDYWYEKIHRNKERDKEVTRYYRKQGWKIFRVWEHTIKQNPRKVLAKITSALR